MGSTSLDGSDGGDGGASLDGRGKASHLSHLPYSPYLPYPLSGIIFNTRAMGRGRCGDISAGIIFNTRAAREGVRLREGKKNRSLPRGKLRPIKRSEDLRCH